MTYRDALITRHRQILAAPQEPLVLDYLGLRNLESLQAWRNRLRGNVVATAEPPAFGWMTALFTPRRGGQALGGS
jgi:hypothetical protein